MNPRILSGILALCMLAPAIAAPASVGVVVEQAGKNALARGVAPGIAIAVVRDGRIVAEQGFGFANLAQKNPVTPHTRFAVGSLTKQMTAAAVMLLVHQGKLHLSDVVAHYIPALPNAKTITVAMLLHQTSGLHNYPYLNEQHWPTRGKISTTTLLSFLTRDPFDFAPGTKWEYSNTNYAALTAIIENVSGESYATFLHNHIFVPAGMSESGYGFAAQSAAPLAVGYVNHTPSLPALSLDLYSGAGGVVASVHDMAQWDLALMAGDVVAKTDLATMWSPGALNDGTPTTYGMGWIPRLIAGHREVWHNGLAPGAGGYCYNAIFPDDHLAVVVLTNGFGAMGVPESIVATIAASYGIGEAPVIATPPPTAAGDDPTIDLLAQHFWNQLASNQIDLSRLAPSFAQDLTPTLRTEIAQGIQMFGPMKSWTFVGTSDAPGLKFYRYHIVFASGTAHDWAIAMTPDGKIAGSRLLD